MKKKIILSEKPKRKKFALTNFQFGEPQFDACTGNQEELAIKFCQEIAGRKGEKGSPPDPVRLLEMARALYKAERICAAPETVFDFVELLQVLEADLTTVDMKQKNRSQIALARIKVALKQLGVPQ